MTSSRELKILLESEAPNSTRIYTPILPQHRILTIPRCLPPSYLHISYSSRGYHTITLFVSSSTLTIQSELDRNKEKTTSQRQDLQVSRHKAGFGPIATITLCNLESSLIKGRLPFHQLIFQKPIFTLLSTMSSSRTRRIAKEVADIHSDNLSNIKADPVGNGDDLTHLKGSFKGPPGTPYEGGTYTIDVKIPNDYPFRPPVMKFDTKVWHPNVSSQTVRKCPLPYLSYKFEADKVIARELFASIPSPLLGLPFSPSNPPSCHSNPS